MCAINGFNFNNRSLVLKMNEVTAHRGPDGTGVFCNDKVSLGHNRLSIIDLSKKAAQPMESDNGNLVIVFNGEIYNFNELKKELSGYLFKTKSDTEVILASYKEWGEDCVKKFNGIFAFAIWDKQKQKLFLARDHMGVKPLYYFWDGKSLIFSSEIKAILEHDVPRVLNKEAFNHYMRILYTPCPLTMFDGIHKLPPASYAILKGENFKITKYWQCSVGKYSQLNKPELITNLKTEILGATERQLVSDRPVGIYLSGGVDSSVVLHNVSKLRDKIDTFSVGFELSSFEESQKFNADFDLAKKTADYYETNHHEVLLSSEDVLKYFEKAVFYLDEPISNATSIAQMKLAEFSKNEVDVVLGGDGGDELFGGYERYRLSLISNYYQKLPASFRDFLNINSKLRKLNISKKVDRFALFMFQKDEILSRVLREEFFDRGATKEFFGKSFFDDVSEISFEELFMNTDKRSWLVDESLMRTDKMSMVYGLEARVPLLDKSLVEFASVVPLRYKVNLLNTKILLKEAYRKDLPGFLFKQPKRGWFSPSAKWLRDSQIYKMTQNVLSEEYYSGTKNLFLWDNIREILDNHVQKKEYNLTVVWSLLTFQVWAKKYNIKI